jgi:hypothetical protein
MGVQGVRRRDAVDLGADVVAVVGHPGVEHVFACSTVKGHIIPHTDEFWSTGSVDDVKDVSLPGRCIGRRWRNNALRARGGRLLRGS